MGQNVTTGGSLVVVFGSMYQGKPFLVRTFDTAKWYPSSIFLPHGAGGRVGGYLEDQFPWRDRVPVRCHVCGREGTVSGV